MPWLTNSKGQRVWQTSSASRASAKPKTTEDLSNQNKLPDTTKRDEMIARNKARSEAEFKRTQPSGTTYDPQTALQQRPKGAPPVSPYVGIAKPDEAKKALEESSEAFQLGAPPTTPTPEPKSETTEGVSDYTTQAEEELEPGYEQWKKDMEGLFDQFEEQKDEKIESYEKLYDHQIETFNELEKMMRELTAQKNALVAGSAKVQQAEIQAAYDANQEQLKIAKMRLDETQRKVMAEREKQLDRKKMNEENMLAVIGGFGSMAGNKMLIDSVEEGEQAVAELKTEFSFQDQEHTGKVVKLTNDYKNDKLKIEQWKQEKIMDNYSNLQSYIANIMNDKKMAYEDKINAINSAKDQYNNTISQISKDVIDARFELSRDVIKRADQLREITNTETERQLSRKRTEIEDARADLALFAENYTLEDYGTLSDEVKQKFDELEKKAELPSGFTEVAIKNFKEQNKDAAKVMSQVDEQGNWTIVGVNKDGQVIATSTLKGAGKTTIKEPTNEVEEAFGVGTVGDWCGVYADRVSTAPSVGDTWAEKISKTDTSIIPKGSKPPTPGDKLVIPLGVTDKGKDYGHVAVVLAYNPENGVIQVTESNKDGRQNRGEGKGLITMGEYNVNDLSSQYGDDWGFIPGELKGDYAKQAEKLGLTSPPADPYADVFNDEEPAEPVEEIEEEVATPKKEYDYDAEFEDFE